MCGYQPTRISAEAAKAAMEPGVREELARLEDEEDYEDYEYEDQFQWLHEYD